MLPPVEGRLFFDQVRVPAENLLGEEGGGFAHLIRQLPQERLIIAMAETAARTRRRTASGTPLIEMRNTRFELPECATLAHAGRGSPTRASSGTCAAGSTRRRPR